MPNFSFSNTIKRLLHPYYRTKVNIAFLMGYLAPARRLRDRFVQLQNKLNYDIQFNSQTLSLEARLNEEYNLVTGTIYIETISRVDNAQYISWLSENQDPVYTRWLSETSTTPVYVRWLSEPAQGGVGVDFIVWVPLTLNFDSDRMKAIIDLYKLAGKRYAIQRY